MQRVRGDFILCALLSRFCIYILATLHKFTFDQDCVWVLCTSYVRVSCLYADTAFVCNMYDIVLHIFATDV